MTLKISNIEDTYISAGLSNGGKKIIKCSMCDEPLGIIQISRPFEKDPTTGEVLKTKIKINCFQCKDESSFVTTIEGGFHTAGFHLEIKGDKDNVIPKTELEFVDMKDNLIIFKARKV